MTQTRCPRPACGAIFEIEERNLGRCIPCAVCGTDFTARPQVLWERLVRREALVRAGDLAAAAPASEDEPRRLRRYLYHPAPEGSVGDPQDLMFEASLDEEAAREPPVDLVAVLDDVRSQWNVGAIFRTADAAGFAGLHLCGITPIPPSRKVVKTALGSDAWVPWSYHAGVLDALAALKAEGRELIGLELTHDAVPVFDFEPPRRAALVLGNEVVGISAEALACCTRRVSIPMSGRKGSLNVAVAFGVAAFALARAWRRGACEV